MTDSKKLLLNLKDVIALAKKHVGEIKECENNYLHCMIEEYEHYIEHRIEIEDDDICQCPVCYTVFKK